MKIQLKILRLIVLKIFVLMYRCSLHLIFESQSYSILIQHQMLPMATNNMCVNSGYFWFALATSDFAPVAATFGYQYKALVVQGILQLCETPTSIILYVPLSLTLSSRFKAFFIILFG